MRKRQLTAIFLTLAMVLAAALSGCGSSSGDGGTKDGGAKDGGKETTVTAETKEDAKALADAFYAEVLNANPVSMTFYSDGSLLSEFKKSGDTFSSGSPDMDVPYYGFIEDGVKYMIYDGETAFADESIYDMTAGSMKLMLDMFVTGYYNADDGALQFSATRTDDAGTSKLVTVITGENEGQATTITVTGTAENGAVSDILCKIESGEETGNYELKFSYDDVSVELPAYTIGESDGGYGGVAIEGTHVDSPIKTLGELIATLGEDENLFCLVEDGHAYAVGERDGRQYQFAATLSTEDQEALDALDFFSDTYDQDREAILARQIVDDCIDFTDVLVPQSELDTFAGKTVEDVVDAGYELTGWMISDGYAEVTFEKDYMDYNAQVTPTEGFDPDSEFENEDLYGFTVTELRFSEPEYVALPIR